MTHRVPLIDFSLNPLSDNTFLEPTIIKATNDNWPHFVLTFNDTATRDGFAGSFEVPSNYVGSAAIIVVWSTTATSGDVEWDFDYRSIGADDAESFDQATAIESVNQNDTAPSAAHERMVATLNLTSANISADETLQWKVFRDGTDAGDTIAAAVQIYKLIFQYSDA